MEVKDVFRAANRLGACSLFTGKESVEELLHLFTTPQGLEFYQKTGFPSIEIARQFSGDDAQKAGIYIDAGDIEIQGAAVVVLVGNTHAKLTYNDAAEFKHNVTVMHGAAAEVVASNYAVVFTCNLGGTIKTTVADNAIVQ